MIVLVLVRFIAFSFNSQKYTINHIHPPSRAFLVPMEIRPKPMDLKEKYDTFFPIFSNEEGKRLYSLSKRNICMPKYFDDQILKEIERHDFMNVLCKRLGWYKLKTVQYDVFVELTIEFYTTLKIKNKEPIIFSCRLFRKEYDFDWNS